MSELDAATPSNRLVSLDAYRGFVMLAMASGGLGLLKVAEQFPDSRLWDNIAYQVDHAAWRGCSFWDLIQPSFMFIVGVAMPFSYANRVRQGQSWTKMFIHAIVRSLILIALGIFLRSTRTGGTNFTFEDVLTQIGLGYTFVFLLLGRPLAVQLAALALILIGDWALFAAYPRPMVDPFSVGLPGNWHYLQGFQGHWEKNLNPAWAFDVWFLNLFPRHDGKPFAYNAGGYATLNFIPSMATMLIGVLAGRWLRTERPGRAKVVGLVLAGAVCLVAGTMLDETYCPVVKRIWTPSWVIYSSAWTCWLLAAFYAIIDVGGRKGWAFPFVVVGANSIVMYVMAGLIKGWTSQQVQTHVGTLLGWLRDRSPLAPRPDLFAGTYGPIVQSASALVVLWLVCFVLYRKRIFIRI